mmetsp:Transcript_17490/g.16824  ORF Transcript_17490/g.16824 Transcript_17490/m.16824 type:complete len:214 (-) Transcript_17490:2051-2692(-)
MSLRNITEISYANLGSQDFITEPSLKVTTIVEIDHWIMLKNYWKLFNLLKCAKIITIRTLWVTIPSSSRHTHSLTLWTSLSLSLWSLLVHLLSLRLLHRLHTHLSLTHLSLGWMHAHLIKLSLSLGSLSLGTTVLLLRRHIHTHTIGLLLSLHVSSLHTSSPLLLSLHPSPHGTHTRLWLMIRWLLLIHRHLGSTIRCCAHALRFAKTIKTSK